MKLDSQSSKTKGKVIEGKRISMHACYDVRQRQGGLKSRPELLMVVNKSEFF